MALKNVFGLINLEATQSDNRTILDMILNFLEDVSNRFPRKDTANRQCVRIEAIDGALTLSTVTTVAQLTNMGVYSTQMIPFQASFPTHLYDRIVVS